jgi:transposase
MTKYSNEQWLAEIQAVEAGEGSIEIIAEQHQVYETGLEYRVLLFREHGEKGLRNHTYNFTADQKYRVLEYMHENHLSCRETGIQFGISGSSTVWQWEQRYREKGIMGLENKKKGRKPSKPKPKPPKTRGEELLEENLYLRAENEYLKKLNALVAEREKREKGNK